MNKRTYQFVSLLFLWAVGSPCFLHSETPQTPKGSNPIPEHQKRMEYLQSLLDAVRGKRFIAPPTVKISPAKTPLSLEVKETLKNIPSPPIPPLSEKSVSNYPNQQEALEKFFSDSNSRGGVQLREPSEFGGEKKDPFFPLHREIFWVTVPHFRHLSTPTPEEGHFSIWKKLGVWEVHSENLGYYHFLEKLCKALGYKLTLQGNDISRRYPIHIRGLSPTDLIEGLQLKTGWTHKIEGESLTVSSN